MSDHTPTPWNVDPTPNESDEQHGVGGERIYKVVMKSGGLIADVSAWWVDHESAKANAAFIVRACNAHDDLMALRDAVGDYLAVLHNEYASTRELKIARENLHSAAILAKAKGE